MTASAVHCHYFASHPCQTVPHIYIFSCIHQDLFFQRSLRVVNSDTDPRTHLAKFLGVRTPQPLPMDAPMAGAVKFSTLTRSRTYKRFKIRKKYTLYCNAIYFHTIFVISCIFMPCHLVRQLHVLQFHVRHVQSTRHIHVLLSTDLNGMLAFDTGFA